MGITFKNFKQKMICMRHPEIDHLLDQVQIEYRNHIDSGQSAIKAIYLYGSYMRNDFIKGQSDLDFAIFLDVEEEVEHWIHPEFTLIANFTRELFTQLLTGYCRTESPDICSFSLIELRKASQNELQDMIGPLKLLTFLAFDFLAHNRLLWGEDVLQCFTKIPDPVIYAEDRFKWIKKVYLKQTTTKGSDFFKLLASLGTVIQYFAILNGIRSITKSSLRSWALAFNQWPPNAKGVLTPYFDYILGQISQEVLTASDWMNKARSFIEYLLKSDNK